MHIDDLNELPEWNDDEFGDEDDEDGADTAAIQW